MPTITYKLKYKSFNPEDGLVISSSELLDLYFFGIPICTADGRALDRRVIDEKIAAAMEHIEDYLAIKLFRQIVSEERDFILDQFKVWGHLRVNYPVRMVVEMSGWVGGVSSITYPNVWASQQETSDEKLLWRNIHIVPSGRASNVAFGAGIMVHLGFAGYTSVPNYWTIKYCTGFKKIPRNLIDVIGKLSSNQLFSILGDILLGAGIASQSLSFDGLSESISTTQSAENSAYSARVRQYERELKHDLPKLKDLYKGITFKVV